MQEEQSSQNTINLTSVNTIKDLLDRHGVSTKKRLGQNFIVNKGLIKKMIDTADIDSADTIIEVGPGIGTMTIPLADKASGVVAVEKDQGMVTILKETVSHLSNVEILNQDILKTDLIPYKRYKVVANLPYYITSPIIRLFLEEAPRRPDLLALMIQKEVAQRICSKPPNMNILALSVQLYGSPKIIGHAKKGSFWPVPDVDSSILRIVPHSEQLTKNPQRFFEVVRAGFSQPRKHLGSNISEGLGIERARINEFLLKNDIDPSRRAETLSLKEWLGIVDEIYTT